MNKVGLIVDGLSEFAAFRARFRQGQRILKTDGPRGHTTTPRQIVAYSRKQIEILRAFGCVRIVVVTDFENRPGDYSDFVASLKSEFTIAFPECCVRPAVPNQMLENWYLADISFIASKCNFLKRPSRQRHYEGKEGKRLLKALFRSGNYYSEVDHGPIFFTLLRFKDASAFSPSLSEFIKALELPSP